MDRTQAFEVAREVVGDADQTYENAEGKFGVNLSYHVGADQVQLVGYRTGYPLKKQSFNGDTPAELRQRAAEAVRKLRDDLGVPFEQVVGGKPVAGHVKQGAYRDPQGKTVDPSQQPAPEAEAAKRSHKGAASTKE